MCTCSGRQRGPGADPRGYTDCAQGYGVMSSTTTPEDSDLKFDSEADEAEESSSNGSFSPPSPPGRASHQSCIHILTHVQVSMHKPEFLIAHVYTQRGCFRLMKSCLKLLTKRHHSSRTIP
mmetsp:Transcript_27024/g.43401  ORF Transcript_27024/g.43401 Transcript_27024/m.43401 type:complete len:121 (-) Transcript_27024:195-557(-)